ncbi:MAG: NADH-quinone oxidoreductase subunit NuoH [Verrucomicrobiota bacterium]|nr:NADH-quinone oxidoreductase subunit NuoH [Verrucomicrobiota bacterium]
MSEFGPAAEFVLFSAIKVAAVIAVTLFMVSYLVFAERKIAAAVQDRLGPNRVGPLGLLQPIADAVKALLKEEFTPANVRVVYYWLAPAIVMVPSLLVIAVIPFGSQLGAQKMVIADLNVGILYTFGIASLGVYGIVLAGYGSNSKYPFISGLRSGAQVISYEVAMTLSVVPAFMLVGDLNLSAVVEHQAGGILRWLAIQQPLAFLIFLATAFAETNRLPFDMPEAEQELAGGYNVEYSSIKFALFFMAEYANMIAVSGIIVTLFLGGWTLPWFGLDRPAQEGEWLKGLAHVGIFLAKVVLLLLFFVWVRWMWPRLRYDQLMGLAWKRLVPLAAANIVITALWLWWRA